MKDKAASVWIASIACFVGLLVTAFLMLRNKKESVALVGVHSEAVFATTEKFSSDELQGSLSIDMYLKLHDFPNGWAKSPNPTAGVWTPLIQKYIDDRQNEFCLRLFNEQAGQWYFGSNEGPVVLNFTPFEIFPLDEWFRLTAIRDLENREMSIWIDGKRRVSWRIKDTEAVLTDSAVSVMGDSLHHIDGSFAEVRVWSKALNDDEMVRTALPGTDLSEETRLAICWRLTPDSLATGVVEDRGSLGENLHLHKRQLQ